MSNRNISNELAISKATQELLALIKKRKGYAKEKEIIPRGYGSEFPLSFAQERLWFLDQLIPGNPFYNMRMVLSLQGKLNIYALRQTLVEIVRRHEVLRTRFEVIDGEPLQVIEENIPTFPNLVDLKELSNFYKEKERKRIVSEESVLSFDLERDLLLRARLLLMDEDEYTFQLTTHHIAFDGWSMSIFQKEFVDLYKAFSNGEASPLPELSIQYADFALWQRKWLSEEVLDSQFNYWKKQLSGLKSLEIPTDRKRPAVETFQGDSIPFLIEPDITKKLQVLGREKGGSLYMILLAAFAILLSRYSGQEDIAVGSPIANRNRKETEDLIGFFVNILVMRMDLSGNPTLFEFIERVRKTCMDAYSNQDMPFERLVAEVQPERDMSRSPLVQIVFSLQNAQDSAFKIPELNVCPMGSGAQIVRYDMEAHLWTKKGGLAGSFVYNRDLYESATISRMVKHFHKLLECLVNNPEVPISEMNILSEEETHKIVVEWNDTEVEYPIDKFIHEVFEETVEITPDSIAVVFEDSHLTYSELNMRSNQLAHYLRSLGIKPSIPVGVCMERSLEMIIGILGILKAGGVYVPLDPEYPEERLIFMLSDSQAPVLLIHEKLAANIFQMVKKRASGSKPILFCIDSDWKDIARRSKENPSLVITKLNSAYIIYTSGSTGKPKGVIGHHKGLYNLAYALIEKLDLKAYSRVLQFASFSFDASIMEIFMALCSGATLCMAKIDSLLPGFMLEEVIDNLLVTHLALPPSTLALIDEKKIKTVYAMIIGSETCSNDLAGRWYEKVRFFHAYGPTESTVISNIYECLSIAKKLPIGLPIANTKVFILDSYIQPSPLGVSNELHIGGTSLTLGYLNRSDLTAERFIPNPFDNTSGSRLYKTGDLARYQEEGNIEFIGRIDHQVKIRGYRIELGEIESVMLEHPSVSESVVIAPEDLHRDEFLVAYIVSSKDQRPNVSEIRNFLKKKLPGYMIPSAFVMLDKLPLTPNGKIARKSLPSPERSGSEKEYIPPRTPVEQSLARIWSDVLNIEKIGIHDNFFEIGGHSLLATQIISRVRDVLALTLPVREIFQAPTIEEFSLKIERLQWAKSDVNYNDSYDRSEALALEI